MERRDFIKVAGGSILAGSACGYAFRLLAEATTHIPKTDGPLAGKKWGMVIDLDRCRKDCTACMEACRHENNVALHGDARWDNHWLRKVSVKSTEEKHAEEKEVLLVCNHCDKPPCAQVCPVQATYKRDDGIVIVDHHRCIGCRYCMIACPYNARQFNFKDSHDWENTKRPKRSHGVAEACHLCAHRLDVGELPACVHACRQVGCNAIMVGDINDPKSEVSQIIANQAVKRLKEDLGTEPKVHYLGL